MVTIAGYILLTHLYGAAWSGWLLVLPVIADITLLEMLEKK